jgi:hypothetical protein
MRKILLAIIVAALPALSAQADPPRRQKAGDQTSTGKSLPLKGSGAGNTCAAFGPGFAKVEGTDTCVKIGGAVGVGAGSSGGGR